MLKKFFYPFLFTVFLFGTLNGQNKHAIFNPINYKDSLHSSVLNEQRDFWVVVPENIKAYERLPVIYLLDGDQQLQNLHAVYNSYWGHHLPRMILVGIDNSQNRTRDLTISKVEQHWEENGAGDQFMQFISSELIPFIETNYPVTNYRTLIGHSYGGLFTINMLIQNPDLFQNYIAIDPSIDWDNQYITRVLHKELENNDYSGKNLYLSLAGPLDRDNENATVEEIMQSDSPASFFARSVISFIQEAKESDHGPDLIWDHFPDEIHGSVPLISMINGLKHQFHWYQLENLSEFNNPMTSTEKISALLDYRAAKLKRNFGYPAPAADAEMLLMGGEMFGQMGQPEKGLLFLEKGVEYYPLDEEMWLALALFHENAGHIEKAKEVLIQSQTQIKSDKINLKLESLQDK
jgi:predicted alpha/beta superfamily hydrolase